MKRMSHVRSRRPSRWAVIVAFTVLILLTSGTPSFAAPNRQGAIHRVYVTDVRDVYFVVSWTTDSVSTGSVNYGPASPTCTLSSTANDVLNPAATTTHYVEVSGLTTNTAYCFDVIAGSTTDDNGGPHYSVTTGGVPGSAPQSRLIAGDVFAQGGSPGVADAIVYLQIQNVIGTSQQASARTDVDGHWTYNLGNLRTADNNDYFFWFTGNPITITAQGGIAGTGQLIASVPSGAASVGSITLNGIPTAVQLASFTATPAGDHNVVAWETVSELHNLGFNLWRGTSTGAPNVKSNQYGFHRKRRAARTVSPITTTTSPSRTASHTIIGWTTSISTARSRGTVRYRQQVTRRWQLHSPALQRRLHRPRSCRCWHSVPPCSRWGRSCSSCADTLTTLISTGPDVNEDDPK